MNINQSVDKSLLLSLQENWKMINNSNLALHLNKIWVHKFMLAIFPPYFAAMFTCK